MNELATKFELHYFFSDNSHTMNAVTRNRCEHELLEIITEVASLFEIRVSVETEAYGEGGLKEIWSFAGKNSNQITLILLILTLILSRVPTTNKDLEHLKEVETRLSIEEKRLNIEKLKYELRKIDEIDHEIDIEGAVEDLDSQVKLIKHKSNFYSHLLYYNKVTKISTSRLNDNYQKIEKEKVVERKDFDKFILRTDILPSEIDDKANIEIISPVLKKGNYKWKGIYQAEPIVFYMKDKEFKNSVIQDGVQFKSGTFIECVLEKDRKIDNLGEIKITGYSVTTVISKYDDVESIETPQGKRYWRKQKAKESQMSIFDINKQE